MSRAYRIKVRECLRRTIRAHDQVQSDLELLDILPAETMAGLLRQELLQRGFQEQGGVLARRSGKVKVSVDVAAGTVTVQAEHGEQLELEGEREGRGYEEQDGKSELKKRLQGELREHLEEQAGARQAALQSQLADELEAQLGDLRQELDQVVNRVTAEALKRKAAQLGSIKEISEDPQAGSLTIVLEV
jgi:hypothetical protein